LRLASRIGKQPCDARQSLGRDALALSPGYERVIEFHHDHREVEKRHGEQP
jgi:hypothetical protein